MPSLPAAKTATLLAPFDFDPSACGVPFSDGSGNLYMRSEYAITSGKKPLTGDFLFAPLNSGLVTAERRMAPGGWFTALDPDGALLSRVETDFELSIAGVQANGGVVVAVADCLTRKTIRISRIDWNGLLTSEVELADQECLPGTPSGFLAVAVDEQDRTFLATDGGQIAGASVPEGHMAVRWFDAAGQPITDWFAAGGPTLTDAYDGARAPFPLIGGGVALRAWGDWTGGDWVGMVPSGKAEVDPPPVAFRPHSNVVPVLGRRAYALVSWTVPGGIDIVEPGGKVCGSLPVGNDYYIGADGSLIHVDPEGRDPATALCTVTYYPQALK